MEQVRVPQQRVSVQSVYLSAIHAKLLQCRVEGERQNIYIRGLAPHRQSLVIVKVDVTYMGIKTV